MPSVGAQFGRPVLCERILRIEMPWKPSQLRRLYHGDPIRSFSFTRESAAVSRLRLFSWTIRRTT